ncbi:Hypothetical protein POVR2_LOCUS149 [uncultured virus]|nr:Hypothetical protein POVR2_LOCUS149 [uncultured virus]
MQLEGSLDLNWVKIYDRLAASIDRLADSQDAYIFSTAYSAAINDLDVLKVFVQVKKPQTITDLAAYASQDLESVDSLAWMLDNVYVEKSAENILWLLKTAVRRDYLDIVKYIEEHYGDTVDISQSDALKIAVDSNSLRVVSYYLDQNLIIPRGRKLGLIRDATKTSSEILTLLLKKYGSGISTEELVVQAHDSLRWHPEKMEVIFEYLSSSGIDLTDKLGEIFYDVLYSHGDPEDMELLLRYDPRLAINFNRAMLMVSVKNHQAARFVPIILRYVDPSKNNNEVLRALLGVYTPLYIIMSVLRDPRVKLDSLNNKLIELVLRSLLETEPVQGFFSGRSMVTRGPVRVEDLLARGTVATSVYSKLLLFLLIKQPSSYGAIIDWMIEQRDGLYQQAASNVLAGKRASNAIEGMLLALRYKSLKPLEILTELHQEEASNKRQAMQLIGAAVGRSRMQNSP